MRRRLIAAAWIAGATVPLLAATVFMVGCCVLPFHGVIHKLMPLCEMAVNAMRADPADDDHQQEPEATPPVKRIVITMPAVHRVADAAQQPRAFVPRASTSYRSFIAHGALRCDQDVGLNVLVETFLI